ncbi:MAG: DUF4412 domain-containing protein [Flavobacteriales bacterium]|nr:DUF4412 domain-containing protein [Flavobacteriales bacterium]
MKKVIAFLFAAIITISQTVIHAQNFEGHLTMKMEVLEVPAELESMKSMFESNISIDVKGERSRTEMTNPVTGNMIMMSDPSKNEFIMLLDMMGEKSAVTYKLDEYKAQKKSQDNVETQIKKTGQTKTIAGHKCEKVIATMKTSDGTLEMEVWCAQDIQNVNTEMDEYPGMPLEYNITTEGINMHFIVTEIQEKKVDESLFTIPTGYKKMTSQEFEKNFGGK